ncbi:MAG: transketolase [Spirochaetaceae bacterium]|nr:MAG: transketolase [Spirochaetaceae bacterium]
MKNATIDAIALTVRSLVMDAVEEAGTGHPGLPMGLAELGAVLYGEVLNHCPDQPQWPNRDRFVLSAGHGSLLQYSLMFLSGYPLALEDIKRFRKMDSLCPGHPEYGLIPGIETTTGPLGQGVGNAVGMAIAEEMLAARFNTPSHSVVDHFTYVIASDGDMMEGVCSEACSLAGHLGLGKLIVFYDMNGTTIEGPTSLTFTEDVAKRFEAYRWQVLETDAYQVDNIRARIESARAERTRPSLICVRSLLGKGAPNKEGRSIAHGAPLGAEEIEAARVNLGLPKDHAFYIDPRAVRFFDAQREHHRARYARWEQVFQQWSAENLQLRYEWDSLSAAGPQFETARLLSEWPTGELIAPRKASGTTLELLMQQMPGLVGGSADLSSSNNVNVPGLLPFDSGNRSGRMINFGVREHAMAAIVNGITLHGGYRAFGATYLVFSDYMRAAIRLAALMQLPSIFVLTHDSIHVGEDGPTHQPVEHLAALRAIPNLQVLRPSDAHETAIAWEMAISNTAGPTALILARQALPVHHKHDPHWQQTIRAGAYVVRDPGETAELVLLATGSEVTLALEAADECGHRIRVVSMIERERFANQTQEFRDAIIPPDIPLIVVEAGIAQGWESYAAGRTSVMGISRFGLPGPGKAVAERLGLSKAELMRRIESAVQSS